jgi:hypothetical protein
VVGLSRDEEAACRVSSNDERRFIEATGRRQLCERYSAGAKLEKLGGVNSSEAVKSKKFQRESQSSNKNI